MTVRALTTLKLLAVAGLGAADLAVASLTAHPRVDAEYRSHYLDHTATCWIPRLLRADDAMPPLSRQVAQLGYPEACRTLRLGWYDLEEWGVWSRVPHSILRLPRRPDARAVALTVRAAPPPNPAIHVRFVLNGHAADHEIAPGTTEIVTVPLPPEGVPYDPDMRLDVREHATIPGSPPDTATRDVGLGLVSIDYLPTDAAGNEELRQAPRSR